MRLRLYPCHLPFFVQEKLDVITRKKPKKAEESEADTLGQTLDMGMVFDLMIAEFRKDGLLTGFESAASAFKETFLSEGEPDPESEPKSLPRFQFLTPNVPAVGPP